MGGTQMTGLKYKPIESRLHLREGVRLLEPVGVSNCIIVEFGENTEIDTVLLAQMNAYLLGKNATRQVYDLTNCFRQLEAAVGILVTNKSYNREVDYRFVGINPEHPDLKEGSAITPFGDAIRKRTYSTLDDAVLSEK